MDGRDQVTYRLKGRKVDVFTRCLSGGSTAIALLSTQYIVICPEYFTHPPIPPVSTASCLTVDPHGSRFVQNGKSLYEFQMWHLLNVLVNFYVYSTEEHKMDIYGVNACLGLIGSEAMLNAQSYVYYAASKSMIGC